MEYPAIRLRPDMSSEYDTQANHVNAIAVRALYWKTADEGQVHVSCNVQSVQPDGEHVARKPQTWALEEAASNVFQYMKRPDVQGATISLVPRASRAELAAFSDDGQFLRVGAQLYAQGDDGEYLRLAALPSDAEKHLQYIEEFAGRGRIIAVTSRRAFIPDEQDIMIRKAAKSREDSDLDDDSDASSVAPDDDEAYESYSECSSAGADESDSASEVSEDDQGHSSADESVAFDEAEEVEQPSDESELEVVEENNDGDGNSSDESEFDPASYISANATSSNRSQATRRRGRMVRGGRRRVARVDFPLSLDIFSSASRVLRFSRKVPTKLIDSPPVIHPTLSLVVWPLAGTEVLFADFQQKTFFTRSVGKGSVDPSTMTLAVKCHFSSCGQYLHIALLHGRQQEDFTGNIFRINTHLTLEVLTYRLCAKKPSRSPPTPVHRVQAPLGTVDNFLSSTLPCTFTWTPRALYVTSTIGALEVHKVVLFGAEARPESASAAGAGETGEALEPEPSVAPRREFLFFPGSDNKGAQLIVTNMTSKSKHGPTQAVAET